VRIACIEGAALPSATTTLETQARYSADRQFETKTYTKLRLPKTSSGASELGIFHTAESNMIRSAVWLTFTAGSDHVANM
jgi:hypothetical protein